MNSHDPTLLMILSEIALFEFVAIITMLVIFVIKKRKRSQILKNISEAVIEKANEREELLKSTFQGIPSLSEESLAVITHEIIKEEVNFYQYIIDTLYVNDASHIEKLNESLEKMVLPYTNLAVSDAGEHAQESKAGEEVAIPNVDDAIDDFLDDDNIEPMETDNDPEFDLSEQGEIAEIPDDLLDEEETNQG